MEMIDLRSDTVTGPTPEMRQAMAEAVVGDDVYGEDPTVNQLQELAAEMTGKEAALFVASGTMGNLAAILAHCGRGDECIVGNLAHTFLFEAGGISALGGVHSYQVPSQKDGTLAMTDLEAAIRPDDPHDPITRLICLENTHNRCGGAALTPEYTLKVVKFAHHQGIAVHLDGARIFNAAAGLNIPVRKLTEDVDSVTFCLSKGLCAPVGSVLCGSRDFIEKAHRLRKMLGGGMRQAGILAAGGIVALKQMPQRLKDDHLRAKELAKGIRVNPLFDVDEPATNMVYVTLAEECSTLADEFAGKLRSLGIRVGVVSPRRMRLVLHYWIGDEEVKRVVKAFTEVAGV